MMKERKEEKNDMRIDKSNTHTHIDIKKRHRQTDSQSDFDKKKIIDRMGQIESRYHGCHAVKLLVYI